MDKLREEFEQWFNEEMVLHISASNETVVRLMWKAWKASRASIVVDIDWPEANDDYWKDGEEGAYAQGYEVGKDLTAIKVRQAIRSIGLSIKGD